MKRETVYPFRCYIIKTMNTMNTAPLKTSLSFFGNPVPRVFELISRPV